MQGLCITAEEECSGCFDLLPARARHEEPKDAADEFFESKRNKPENWLDPGTNSRL